MSDTQPPVVEEPPGNALSTRGYVIAALVPPLIAAIGIGLLFLHYNPDQLVEGKNIPIILSPWHPGAPSNDTVISGTLKLDTERCVILTTPQGAVSPVFPAGYVATETADGKLNVYDTGHHLIAHDGDDVRATGEVAPVGQYAGRPCAPVDGNVSVIESAVVVTAG